MKVLIYGRLLRAMFMLHSAQFWQIQRDWQIQRELNKLLGAPP